MAAGGDRKGEGQKTSIQRITGMCDRWKQLGKLILQGFISSALVFWLFSNPELRQQLRPALAQADVRWGVAAFVVYGAVEFFGAIRWQVLLRACGFRLSWWEATRILLIGIFFNTLLPGLIAGDALRVVYLSRRFNEKKAEAVLVVLVERLFGLIGLIFFGISMIVWRYDWLHRSAVTGHLTDLALALVGLGAAVILVSVIVRHSLLGRWIAARWLPPSASLRGVRLSGNTILVALATTIAAHLCYAGSFYLSGEAFASIGTTASSLDMLVITPIVNTFTSLPISISGIGVRESLFQVFLHDLCGVPLSAAVLVGSIGFAIRAVWALLGCLFLACLGRLQWNEWTFQLFRHRAVRANTMAGEESPQWL
jgi:uncharacterized membrane protein YbhN (UPF0104 family)